MMIIVTEVVFMRTVSPEGLRRGTWPAVWMKDSRKGREGPIDFIVSSVTERKEGEVQCMSNLCQTLC